ncbi:HAD family hydrolase [Leptolyngbya sp. FACHB-36]|uniref:HAD family hydrolase n=1 Tax=Leptolyngbya sp. FACHB-36 TaxID=2692808 RepID=UPI00168042A9|nr:HAD family hydrolase [Leptolyngbya sp. FACHB-36]MBD2019568.1 HAD family hydrolase [Leptolyngbya sp. FACHB-36]
MVTIQCGSATFSSIQAVIFDKDGTLADSQEYLRNLAHKRARLIDARIPGVQEPLLMAFGAESDRLSPAGLMAVGTRHENEIAAAAYVAETGRDWIEARAIVRSAFEEADQVFKRKADQTPVLEDGRSLVRDFAAVNLKLALLSSDTTENVRDFAQRYELEPYFQCMLGTDEGTPSKPHPYLLQHVSQQLGVEPETVLVVGDSQVDVELARNANAAGCIGVTWGGATAAQLLGAAAIVSQFDQIQVLP